MRVLLFAGLAEACGRREIELAGLPAPCTVGALEAALRASSAQLAGARFRIAVNRAYARSEDAVAAGDEIALIPPVSGGRGPLIAVGAAPIDVPAVLAAVEGPGEGGVVLFLGRVRDVARERQVARLDYEAYAGMAESELLALAEEARASHGASRVAIVHRTGTLQIGEVAVAIAVAAAHRAPAFAACAWLIDALKQRAPIWKREHYADGSAWISDRP